jgi:hypothetical protein
MKNSLTPYGLCLGFLSAIVLLTAVIFQVGCAGFRGDVSTAVALVGHDLAYAESLAVQWQKANTAAGTLLQQADTLASDAGLMPANSTQAKIYADIKAALATSTTASNIVVKVNQILSPANLQAIVSPPTSMLKLSPQRDLRPIHGWRNPYSVQLAKQ